MSMSKEASASSNPLQHPEESFSADEQLDPEPGELASESQSPTDTNKRVILVVEDQPQNLKLIRTILDTSGYGVVEATDGLAGVELARQALPDVILMDVRMPVMDGVEATSILKSDPITSNIPIIALTAHAMKEEKEKMMEAGCDEYLTKPIDAGHLRRQLKAILDLN